MTGYDSTSNQITDAKGGIALIDDEDRVAAIWHYAQMMDHWNRKHATAVYVPSMVRREPSREYQFANRVRLGIGTDFLKFLAAMATGGIYLDPAVKVVTGPAGTKLKCRNQFRMQSKNLAALYAVMETVDVCA